MTSPSNFITYEQRRVLDALIYFGGTSRYNIICDHLVSDDGWQAFMERDAIKVALAKLHVLGLIAKTRKRIKNGSTTYWTVTDAGREAV